MDNGWDIFSFEVIELAAVESIIISDKNGECFGLLWGVIVHLLEVRADNESEESDIFNECIGVNAEDISGELWF